MISMSTISSAGGTSKYMTEQATTEYYAGEQVPSVWEGQGAEIQGLAGREVTGEELTKQLEGKVVEFDKEKGEFTEKQLGVTRGGETQHRAGWDLTFSAPKSVSIESEVFGNKDVREAHEMAVSKAMSFLEDKAAQTRVNGEFQQTGNLTYAKFEHATSRAGDPQTHTHVIVANVTYYNDKAYSLSNEKLMDYRATADAVYKNELASNLQSKGYEVQWDKSGNFEIVGYSKENLETFSKRSNEIKDALAERGMDKDTASHEARQTAALDTRHDKNHPESAEAHRDKWQAEAEAAGVKQAKRDQVEQNYNEKMQNARDAVESAIKHLTEREQAFSDKDLWKESTRFSQGNATTDQIYSAINEQLKSGNMIEREDGKFTTRDAIEAEKFAAEHLSQGHGAHEAVMTNKEFDAALAKFEERKGFNLTEEQRNASRMILTGDDRFQGVQGLAGTGKTTMLEFVREAAESKGWEVKGFSNGGAQADKMQAESGIQSSTTARYLIEFEKTRHDADLASRAVATYEKNQGIFGDKPDWKELDRQVKSGEAKQEYDSEKRMYITDKEGNTWTPALYNKVTEIESKNLNHAGLTDTKYIVTDKGVFKSGGSLGSELAGALKDYYNENRAGKAGDVDYVVNKALTSGQQWEKCNVVESLAVKAACNNETEKNHAAELSALKEQAAKANGTQTKTLQICDEASMSGQREFNNVISATEQTGARTVFLGDEKQHQAVEAGKGFELAQDHMRMSELGQDSIRRQTTDHAKEAVSTILEGKHEDAVKGLDTKEISSHQDAVREKYADRETMSDKDKAAMRDELKEAARQDNREVIREIAKDYTSQDREARDKTLIVTSTNADRNAINNEIRDMLKSKGELQNGTKIDTLEKTGLTKEEAKVATNFEKGQVVEFTKDYKTLGVESGDRATVESVDSRTNTVTARTESGQEIKFNPEKIEGKELFNQNKGKEFAVGDKVAFTKNDSNLDVKNGQTGTIEKIEGGKLSVKMENGQMREFDTKDFKHIDHAYAMTSHKSQGQTFDKVMIHHNTEGGRHGDRETYVNVTRAREDVTVYTQNADKAAKQAGTAMNKESAQIKDTDRAQEPVKDKVQDKPTERETQVEPSKEYQAAVSKAEQSLPKQSKPEQSKPEQSSQQIDYAKEREIAQKLGVGEAIRLGDAKLAEMTRLDDAKLAEVAMGEAIKAAERNIDAKASPEMMTKIEAWMKQANDTSKVEQPTKETINVEKAEKANTKIKDKSEIKDKSMAIQKERQAAASGKNGGGKGFDMER